MKNETPSCFGSYSIIQPHNRAENCCDDCPFNRDCTEVKNERS